MQNINTLDGGRRAGGNKKQPLISLSTQKCLKLGLSLSSDYCIFFYIELKIKSTDNGHNAK